MAHGLRNRHQASSGRTFGYITALVRQNVGQCDVLKVAHHGSNHSSTSSFLNMVQPKLALISLGENNRYGHPGEESMSRLERTGAEIYRTDTMGSITVTSDGKTLSVETNVPIFP